MTEDLMDDVGLDKDLDTSEAEAEPTIEETAYVSLYVHYAGTRLFAAVIPTTWQEALIMYSDFIAMGARQWKPQSAKSDRFTLTFAESPNDNASQVSPLVVREEHARALLELMDLQDWLIDTMLDAKYAAQLYRLSQQDPKEMQSRWQTVENGGIILLDPVVTLSA